MALFRHGIRTRPGPGVLPAVGLVIMWSSGFIGAELGTRYAPADTLLAWRYLVAGSVLAGLALMRGTRMPRAGLLRHGALGLLCQALYLGGVVTGVGLGVPPGTAALIAALQPLVVSALASRLLREASTGRQRWGLVIGIGGVALVVSNDVGAGASPITYFLPFGGMLALSVGTVLERRWRTQEPVLDSLTVQTVAAAGFFVAMAAGAGHLAPPADPNFWFAVAWVVVLSGFGGYGFYFVVLRQRGPTRVSTLLYLTPPTTTLWALVMFGQPVTGATLAGFLVCAGAVYLVMSGGRIAGHPTRSPA